MALENRALLSRRSLLAALPAWILARQASAQPAGVKLSKLHCFEVRVSDVNRSVDFYQRLFGTPVQARTSDRVCLRIADGPQFMALRQAQAGQNPAITQIGYSVEDFDADRTQTALAAVGFESISPPAEDEPGMAHRRQTWIGDRDGTRELFFADDRGLIVQLSATSYCGGVCLNPETPPPGILRLSDLNHFTVFVGDGAAANRFYQQTFGLSVQAYQGPQAPVNGIGDGKQFVMYAGGGRANTEAAANIHHACFNIDDFNVDQVLAKLTAFGLAARGDRRVGPLMHFVSMRMPERGGAEGGTPELYFTDPDGIWLQLQDLSYCGGGGYLGNQCLSA